MTKKIAAILKNLPHKPGVYQHKDAAGHILYIGKAKDLHKRVQSYFRPNAPLDASKQLMVKKIVDIEIIIVNTEEEALILEKTLLKKFRPPYNVEFMDDKAYKFIKIDYTVDFPKIYTTRRVVQDGSKYFGPFTDGFAVIQTLGLIRKIFHYRTCNYDLTLAPHEQKKKFIDRPCLYYYIKKCDAPCVALQSRAEYMHTIHSIEQFLNGETDDIAAQLQKSMRQFSEAHRYEEAAKVRDQLRDIQHVVARQRVVSPKNTQYDVIHLVQSPSTAFINLFLVRNGKLLGKENFSVHFVEGTSSQEILTSFVKQFYQKTQNFPKEILIPEALVEQDAIEQWIQARARTHGVSWKVRLTIPEKGEKKKLLLLSQENASEFQNRQKVLSQAQLTNVAGALKNIASAVGLEKPPHRVEIYDMSNIQGTNAVGSMVVFTDGIADKKQYRRFRVRSFSTPNDVGMMTEVLIRRLSRLKRDQGKDAKWPRPDLIILDGGKPQHKAAREAFRAVGYSIPFISLAKREEEVVVPGRERPVIFPRDSQELFLMQRMRDEAHRFAITYHRNLRSKKAYQSVLDEIPGLGPKNKKKLLRRVGSVKAITEATLEELTEVVGPKLAHTLKEYL